MPKPRPAGLVVIGLWLEGQSKLSQLWERVRPGKEQLYHEQLMLVEQRGGVGFLDH